MVIASLRRHGVTKWCTSSRYCALCTSSSSWNSLCDETEKKRIWIRKWISRRLAQGASDNLFKELALEDQIAYRKVLRLTCEKFEELLEKVHPLIQKKDTLMRPAIPSRTKLEITLRYLATGDSYQSLELLFRVAACTICKFLPEVLDAIKQVLWNYMKVNLRIFISYLIFNAILDFIIKIIIRVIN